MSDEEDIVVHLDSDAEVEVSVRRVSEEDAVE